MTDEQAGYLIMEDLTAKAGHAPMGVGMSLKQCLEAAIEIGRMQAWSLKHNEWRRPDMSATIQELVPEFAQMPMSGFHDFVQNDTETRELMGEELLAKALLLKVTFLRLTTDCHFSERRKRHG